MFFLAHSSSWLIIRFGKRNRQERRYDKRAGRGGGRNARGKTFLEVVDTLGSPWGSTKHYRPVAAAEWRARKLF